MCVCVCVCAERKREDDVSVIFVWVLSTISWLPKLLVLVLTFIRFRRMQQCA